MTIGAVLRRSLLTGPLVVALVAVPAQGPAAAQCEVTVGDSTRDVRSADSPDDAIRVGPDDEVVLTRPDDGALGALVWFGALPVPVPDVDGDAGEEYRGRIGDHDWLGRGLYQVTLVGPGAGPCTTTFWVRVDGPSPLTTVSGLTSLGLALGGAALAASAVRRGRRARCSIGRGVVGGVLLAIGGSAFAQQMFVVILLPVAIVLLVGLAVVGGFVARAACVPVPVVWTLSPVLLAPLAVRAEEEFQLQVGVDAAPPAGRRGPAPPVVTAQLVAGGATVVDPRGWRQPLGLRRDRPRAEAVVRMRATRDVGESYLTVLYAADGRTVGMARRPLWVVPAGGELPPPAADAATVGVPFAVGPTVDVVDGRDRVDLELRATFSGPRALHVTQWTVETPHRDRLGAPDAPVTVDLGDDPEAFTAALLLDVAASDGHAGIHELLLGAGRQLARALEPPLLAVLRQLFDVVPVPRVLLLLEEACVPWELVAVEPAPVGEPPFLATRAVVGRWFLDPSVPVLPPPTTIAAGRRAVLATAVLPAAELEARRLHAELGFEREPPTVSGLLDALDHASTVHLACHGSWRVDDGRWFLELADGRVTPKHVAGVDLEHHPFVVLNACQVGPGGETLGTATGFPAELEFAGASGCVAPLWSVDDDAACRLGVDLERAVQAEEPPAEVLRTMRRQALTDGSLAVTPFAYQYVGHPALRIRRS